MEKIIKKISKGTRFNQIYLQKNEGFEFKPGNYVIITPVDNILKKESSIFEYNVKLNTIKKTILKNIFDTIQKNSDSENIIITGSFLDDGFNFNDIDILIINSKKLNKEKIESSLPLNLHIIPITSKDFNKGIKRDPLFRLMIDKYVSSKRTIFKKDKEIDYKLLDIYLIKNKNLIDGFDLLNINQRKKLLRDFISIKLFVDDTEITKNNIIKEEEKLFGKEIIEKLFFYGDSSAKRKFLQKLIIEYKKLETKILKNVSKSSRSH